MAANSSPASLATATIYIPGQEGRLFKPLAFTKTLTMAIAALLAVTLDPALRMIFTRMDRFQFRPKPVAWIAHKLLVGTYYQEEKHPISRAIFKIYDPACRLVLRYPKATIATAFAIVLSTIPVSFTLGSEFMPPLDEGSILYMPTTLTGISVDQVCCVLRIVTGFTLCDRHSQELPDAEVKKSTPQLHHRSEGRDPATTLRRQSAYLRVVQRDEPAPERILSLAETGLRQCQVRNGSRQ